MKRDNFTFFRSFYEATDCLDEKSQLEVYRAIFKYALDHEEDELSGVSKALFTSFKPVLDSNYSKAISGAKGGKANKTQSSGELEDKVKQSQANAKQTEANGKQNQANGKQNQANGKQSESKIKQSRSNKEKDKEKDKEYIKEIIKEKYSEKKAKAILDYLEMRKAIKKPLTNLDYLDKELNKLSSDEEEQIAILDQSTFSSYQGLFPLKNSNKNVSAHKDIKIVYDDSDNIPVTDEEIENFRKYRASTRKPIEGE